MNRRTFLRTSSATSLSVMLPWSSIPPLADSGRLTIGLIADLHQDIIPDAKDRLAAFVRSMRQNPTDVVVQMGDFATPKPAHQELVDLFHSAPGVPLHVLGNHDTDLGFSPADCMAQWQIPATYYTKEVNGFTLIVLDGNEKGSPDYSGGYPSYIGAVQMAWLEQVLASTKNPVILFSHQPLLGWAAIDNATDVRQLLQPYAERIMLCICGHTHIDQVLREGNILYWHVNSSSYFWVGGPYQHQSYPASIHERHKWLSHTCPYDSPVFARLTVDIFQKRLHITGQTGAWVGQSPLDLGADPDRNLIHGEHIVPYIKDRQMGMPY